VVVCDDVAAHGLEEDATPDAGQLHAHLAADLNRVGLRLTILSRSMVFLGDAASPRAGHRLGDSVYGALELSPAPTDGYGRRMYVNW
jgi:hypothetical protein